MKFYFQQMNKIIIISFITIFFLLFISDSVHANLQLVESTLGPEEEVFDDLFLQGSDVKVAGRVHGMLFIIGERVLIESSAAIGNDIMIIGKNVIVEKGARITGNLLIVGQNVTIKSDVNRNLAVASLTLDLSSSSNIQRNLFFAGFHLSQMEGSNVNENLYAGSYQIALAGSIQENVRISAVSADLDGHIMKNAEIAIDASGDDEGIRILLPYMQQLNVPELLPSGLVIGEDALINGQLIYTSAISLEENLRNLPLGGVIENIPEMPEGQNSAKNKVIQQNPFVSKLLRMVRHAVGFLVFGLIFWKFGNRYLSETVQYATKKPFRAFGTGFISTLVVYLGAFISFVLLIITALLLRFFTLHHLSTFLFIIGISAIVVVLVLFGILLMYISKFVLAYWVGDFALGQIKFKGPNKMKWSLIVGTIISLLLSLIPVFGWIIGVIISFIGIGTIWYALQNHDRAGILPDFE
ncbi:MAG TPA: hypothetical protein VK856_03950 [Anaerolineaceae bacterium]|nr:hypothetical protein [Anaerolineaceae bacterium]